MAEASGSGDNPLWWFLKVMGIVFLMWLVSGGPGRIATSKPFIKPLSPLDTGEQYGGAIGSPSWKGSFTPPTSYNNTNTKYFTVALPPGWKFEEFQTRDNYYAGEFTNGKTHLVFEYGNAPSPLPVRENEYTIAFERVDGVSTKFVTPKKTGDGVTGAFYQRFFGKDLTITGDNLTQTEKQIAFTIMRSVDFK